MLLFQQFATPVGYQLLSTLYIYLGVITKEKHRCYGTYAYCLWFKSHYGFTCILFRTFSKN